MIFSINSKQDLSLDEIRKTIRDSRDLAMQQEQDERDMLNDFYDNLQHKEVYLKDWGFKNKKALPLQTINFTKKVIDKISLVYKKQPDRIFEGEEESSYTQWINENPRFDVWLKEAERRKNLLGVVLKRPIYLKDRGWRFYVDTTFEPHFVDGDPFTPVAYSIPIKHEVTSTNKGDVEEDWWMFWSDKHYFWYQKDSEKMRFDPAFPDGEHNLELMPIVESRTNFPIEEYWTSGATDLVLSNQSININLNNLNYAIHFQAFNHIWVDGINPDEAQKIEVGTDSVTTVPEGASLNNLDLQPKIMEMIDAIKFEIEAISRNYNVNVDWSMSGDPSSGFALLVKNIDLMEAREDDVQLAEMEEQMVYKVIERQQEVYKIKEPRLPKDGRLIVDFHEIDFPINQKEELERWDWEFKNNVSTPVDYIQSKEGLTEEEAEERWNENKKKNERLTPMQESFREQFTTIGDEIINEEG